MLGPQLASLPAPPAAAQSGCAPSPGPAQRQALPGPAAVGRRAEGSRSASSGMLVSGGVVSLCSWRGELRERAAAVPQPTCPSSHSVHRLPLSAPPTPPAGRFTAHTSTHAAAANIQPHIAPASSRPAVAPPPAPAAPWPARPPAAAPPRCRPPLRPPALRASAAKGRGRSRTAGGGAGAARHKVQLPQPNLMKVCW